MDEALVAVQLSVVSWPDTTVSRLADSEIVGDAGGGFGCGVGGGEGGGFRLPDDVVWRFAADPLLAHPAQKAIAKTAVIANSAWTRKRWIFTP